MIVVVLNEPNFCCTQVGTNSHIQKGFRLKNVVTWKFSNSLWQFLEGLFCIWENLEPTLVIFYAITANLQCWKWPQC